VSVYERLLLPTDGSDVSVVAAKASFALARRFDAEIYAVHVVEANRDTTHGETVIGAVEEAAEELDLETTTAVLERTEPIHRHLLEYAADHDADCIVMGTHARRSLRRYALGSVTQRTLREAPVPVVTVHEETRVTDSVEALLVPTDGSECADAAAEHAAAFAAATDASVRTVHVVDATHIDADEAIYDALEADGRAAVDRAIDVTARAGVSHAEAALLSGVPHQAIQEYVEGHEIDYVFMGTHGRTGVSRYLLGSVTERVVRLVDVPVVAVKVAGP